MFSISEEGKRIFPLSRDHKPGDEQERTRIIEGGGQIYQYDLTPFLLICRLVELLKHRQQVAQILTKRKSLWDHYEFSQGDSRSQGLLVMPKLSYHNMAVILT